MSASRRRRDAAAGLALAGLGIAAALKAAGSLHVGRWSDMGPGFFPVILGVGLALCGVAIVIATQWRHVLAAIQADGESFAASPRAIGLVILGVSLFALTIERFGLVPAAFVLVISCALANRKTSPRNALWLALGLSVASWLIFILALGMPLVAFRV